MRGSRFFLTACEDHGNKNPPTGVGGFYQGGARREKEKKGESTAEEESEVYGIARSKCVVEPTIFYQYISTGMKSQ